MARVTVIFLTLFLLWDVVLGREPKWEKDWNRGLEEAVERKVPILIVIPRRRGSQGPIIPPKILDDGQVIALCDKFVCFIADDTRFPDIEKRIAAFYHKGKYGFYGKNLQFVFCRPNGDELEKYRLVGNDVKKGQLVRVMTEVLKLYPEAISKTDFEKCRSLRDLAEMFRKELIYNEAIKRYKELAKQKVKLEMVELAKDKERELLRELTEKISEVEKMLTSNEDADRREAVRRLVKLKVGTRKLKEHQRILELIKRVKEDENMKDATRRMTDLERALKKYLKAEELFQNGRLQKAYGEYKELTRKYRRTEYADRAKERMEEIEAVLAEKKENNRSGK